MISFSQCLRTLIKANDFEQLCQMFLQAAAPCCLKLRIYTYEKQEAIFSVGYTAPELVEFEEKQGRMWKKIFKTAAGALKIRYQLRPQLTPEFAAKFAAQDAHQGVKKIFRRIANCFFIAAERFVVEQSQAQKITRYELIINSLKDGIIMAHLDGEVFFINEALKTSFPTVQIGSNLLDIYQQILMANTQEAFKAAFNSRKKGVVSTYEVQTPENKTLSVRGVPIQNAEGQPTMTVAVIRDVTEERRINRELEESRQIAEKARSAERLFLANMSHEIRTPINAVTGMTHLLLQTEVSAEQLEYLHGIKYSADTLLNLISNILDISKIEAGELHLDSKSFSINALLLQLQQFHQQQIRTQKSISIVICHDDSIKQQIIGDPTRLQQMLANLLTNACKFTVSGTVGISVAIVEETEDAYLLDIGVHDTGIGIAENHLLHIFDNFKQADKNTHIVYGGTGLGLSIVKNLAELQGGCIDVRSQIGKGSTFSLLLPFQKSAAAETSIEILLQEELKQAQQQTQKAQKPSTSQLTNLRVLVAEDNLLNQKLISRLLENWQCKTFFANNGQMALDFLEKNICDLILMDVHMPILDGCQTAALLRQAASNPNQNVPIIALTAAALLEEKQRAFEVGMNEFLTKPFVPEQLYQLLEKYEPQRNTNSFSGTADLALDLSYLIKISNNDTAFISEIIDSFLLESPTELQKLQQACDNNEPTQAAELLHKIQSTYSLVGLNELRNRAERIERELRQRPIFNALQPQEISQICQSVSEYYPIFKNWLANNR
jgi:PAS domain S-box-containing protein